MNDRQRKIEFVADEQSSLLRIDKLLCLHMPQLTRSAIVRLMEEGNVTVAGKPVSKNSKAKPGEVIKVVLPEPAEYRVLPENIPLNIVYEDDDLIIVNKEKGMVVHPAHGNESGTLVHALMYHCKDSLSGINGVMRPGIVHRIDKDTSGLLVVAKNDTTHQGLAEQFKDHSIVREYHTIVNGILKEDRGTVDKPIGRHMTQRKMMTCSVKAVHPKRAVTHYETIAKYNGFTYLKCRLETGRTHQIRVHMADLGHFVVGDSVYGRKINKISFPFEGQCLHAKTLGFTHPVTGERMLFDSELPPYFCALLSKLESLS